MTSTTIATPSTATSTMTVLARALAAEWTRLWSVRSTWLSVGGAAGIMLFMGVVFGLDFDLYPTPVWMAAEFAVLIGQFPLLLVVVLAVTAEYSTGAIRSSLQWVPRRGLLLTARIAVPVAVITVVGVLLSGATDLVAAAVAPQPEVDGGDIARSLGTIAVVLAVSGLLTAGIAVALRSTAGALTTIFLLLLLLPMMLPEFGVDWLATIGEHLPGYATTTLLAALGLDMPGDRAVAVLVAWSAATTTAAAWAMLRRDAA